MFWAPEVGKADDVTSRDSDDLVIVSLLRYADSCDPASRHNDCPFAVERDGRLTCNEECRGVITSLLRRGRARPTSGDQAFDARQLRLSESAGAPDIYWHTASLLQVLESVARTCPLLRDGSFNLRRFVDATSALGALGSRGFDPDHIVRRGLARIVKLGLAAWLKRLSMNSDDPRRHWEHVDRWQAFFGEGISGWPSSEDYIGAIMTGPIAQLLDSWIESAPIEDLLLWTPPNAPMESNSRDSTDEDVEIWTWILERFTQTYLEDWSLASLKREYSFMRGSWSPQFPVELLADRVVTREAVTAALADRALLTDDNVDPSTMVSFTDQALVLLADGQRNVAAALFDAVRALKPRDLAAQNNYAFCILIDRPQEAKALLTDALSRGIGNPAVTWCNLALAESLLRNNVSALNACEQAYKAARDDHDHGVFLWQQRDGDWVVAETKPRPWAVRMGAELEQSSELHGGIWTERLKSLNPLGTEQPSSGPSSTETNEGDL
jgi:hypothetical protein